MKLAMLVSELPERAFVLLLCLVAAVGPLVTFGQFRPYLVLPLFAVLTIPAQMLLPRNRNADRSEASASAVAVLGVVLWVAFNAVFHGQMYLVVRDPAIYTLRATWLVHHASPNIPMGTAYHAATSVDGLTMGAVGGPGFSPVGHVIEAQNASLVPGVVATFGWVGGETGVLCGNLVIGAVALLALYALGRRLLGPIWALLPIGVLSVSMPMVQFARSPYTEPTAMALGLGGLLLLWWAHTERASWLCALGGASLGATFMARPDGLLVVLGAGLGIGVPAVLAISAGRRAEMRAQLLFFVVGAAASVALGLADFARNSSVYEAGTWGEIHPLLVATTAVGVVLVLLCFVPSWPPVRSIRRSMAHPRRLSVATVGVLALAFVALLARPFYVTVHHTPDGAAELALARSLASRQASAGLPVDGTRTYDEHTLNWMAWYYGWPSVLLGGMGVLLLVWQVFHQRDRRLLPLLGSLGVAALLYLDRVNITPDQVWAMRRFLPVVIPLGLVAATVAIVVLATKLPRGKWVGWLLAAIALLAPISTWRSPLVTGEYSGASAFVSTMCDEVAGTDVVLADSGTGGGVLAPTLWARCGVTALYTRHPSASMLAQIRTALDDGRRLTVVSFGTTGTPWVTPPTAPVTTARMLGWEQPLTSVPRHRTVATYSLYVGDVQADGTVRSRS